jgi:hypothetical protein
MKTNFIQTKQYSATINGTTTIIKAFYKENAVRYFQSLDENISYADVKSSKSFQSHQSPVEYEHTKICSKSSIETLIKAGKISPDSI